MAKYKSYLGKMVDMEELRRKHEKTIASGNMGVNAGGDTLGPGGAVTESGQARAKKHYVSRETVSKTNVSIKGDQSNEKIFEDEKDTTKKSSASTSDTTTTPASKRKVEKETESGDIILEDEE